MTTFEAFLVLVALSVLVSVVYKLGRNYLVHRRVRCPQTGREYEVDLIRRYEAPNEPVRIDACSRFADPHEVDCEQDCLAHCD